MVCCSGFLQIERKADLATAPFTLAPEFKLLSGIDPFDQEEVERTVAFVETLLFRTSKATDG